MRRTFAELVGATKPFSVEDQAKSWRLFAFTLAVVAFFTVGTLPQFPGIVRVLSSVLLGLSLVRVFIFYHDYLHGAIFRGSKVGGMVMNAYGVLILNPPSAWKRSHNYHHEHNSQIATASIGSYPIMTVDQYRNATPRERLRYRAARNPFVILIGYVTIFLIGMCGKSFLTDPRRHWDSLLSLLLHFSLIGILAVFGIDVLLLTYILPLATACALGAYLFYIQHNFPDMLLRPRTEWDYVGAALDSSSYMESSAPIRWFTGNIGYHHVHHLNPTIPFYRLPETMAAIPELQHPRKTSLKPSEVLRCLQLKLWDPKRKVMVGWSAATAVNDPCFS